jgi:hypothetical protein
VTAAAEPTPLPGRVAWVPPSYAGWLTVGVTFAVAQSWLARIDSAGGMRVDVVRMVATLLCLAMTTPWLLRPFGPRPAVHQASRTATRSAVIAVTLALLALLAALQLLVNGGVDALIVAIRDAPAAMLFTVPLLAYAEEVYFREALPAALAVAAGDVRWRGLRVAAGSQLLYAIAHLPALLLQPSPRPAMLLLASLLRDVLFGLMLLTLVRGPAQRVVRVLVHTVANLSVILLPPSAAMHAWRGPMMCLLGAFALSLARSTCVPHWARSGSWPR